MAAAIAGADALAAAEMNPESARNALREIYALTAEAARRQHTRAGKSGNTVDHGFPSQLYTAGLDAEQIWQQVELLVAPMLPVLTRHIMNSSKRIKQLIATDKTDATSAINSSARAQFTEDSDKSREGSDIIDDAEDDDDDDDDHDGEDGDGMWENDEGESTENNVGKGANIVSKRRKGKDASRVEDDFFRIDDLERFLEDAEASGRIGQEANDDTLDGDGDEEADDEEAELLQQVRFGMDASDEEDDDEEMETRRDDGSEAMYADFFGKPAKNAQVTSRDDTKASNEESEEEEDGDDDDDDDNDDDVVDEEFNTAANREGGGTGALAVSAEARAAQNDLESQHERAAAKMATMVRKYERENLSGLGGVRWDLSGEVTAKQREMNSALAAELDFESSRRSVPSVTSPIETTTSLEKIISSRIREGRFDDVVLIDQHSQKNDGKEDNLPEVDETKGKGLAEVYEEKWLTAAGGGEGGAVSSQQKLRDEAIDLFSRICSQIDSLSHYYAGKNVLDSSEDLEVKKVDASTAQLPALAAEEALPMVVSDATLAAPQELVDGQTAATTANKVELTREERRTARRKRKRQAKSSGKTISGNTAAGKMAIEMQKNKKAKRDRKTDSSDAGKSKLANSSRFFASLQEQVSEEIARKSGSGVPKSHVKDQYKGRAAMFKM